MNIHRRAGRGHHLARLINAAGQSAGQNIVYIGRNHQLRDRQAHLRRHIARKNIAEIAGRHGISDRFFRRAQLGGRGEIIGNLRHHARPINGIDPRQRHVLPERLVVKHGLHQGLTIVKCAVNRQRMHIGIGWCGHLFALHIRDAAIGKENKHIDGLATAKRLNRRPARIARGCTDNGGALATTYQRIIHQPRQ